MGVLGAPAKKIKKDMADGKVIVAIYGMGRVGLPIAATWLNAGARVIGVDINKEAVARLNRGVLPFDDEPMILEAIQKGLREGKFSAVTDGVEASKQSCVKIIVIPIVLDADKKLANKNLISVLKTIGKGLKKGDVVIIESTVPPLTTESLAKPILEAESGLLAETDFGLAFSPERISEGTAVKDIVERYPKIVGGLGHISTETVSSLYDCIAKKGTIKVRRARDAEASKIFEGIYRDVNIALANELAIACNALEIDFMDARNAANSQPYCHLHMPGIGVGGLCIPIYPYFMMELAACVTCDLALIEKSRKLNESMPDYVLALTQKMLEKAGIAMKNAKVGILGLTFRGGIKDMRLSPAIDFITIISDKVACVKAYDPLINVIEGIETSELEDLVEWADVLVIATDHREFKELDFRHLKKQLIVIDGRNMIDPTKLPAGSLYSGIGKS